MGWKERKGLGLARPDRTAFVYISSSLKERSERERERETERDGKKESIMWPSPTEWIDGDSFDVPFLGNGGRPCVNVTATSLPQASGLTPHHSSIFFQICF